MYSNRCKKEAIPYVDFVDKAQADEFQSFIDTAKRGNWDHTAGKRFKAAVDGILAKHENVNQLGLFCTESPLIFEKQAELDGQKS